ncbi:Thermosome subunit (fragment) [groundwater metagenome]|uniref:Thermosome subunit n=1 Tax=groundwater metagenome TaxID=717931 RepID=A0A098EBP0_9ZZZZ
MAQQQMQVLVLPEGYERLLGGNAMRANISAAKAVSDAVKTTLGPKGMDKMLVDDMGDITITNDGATIVDKLKVEHPSAKLMVEIAKTQDKEVGDGTTTALIYAGKLLEGAMDLFEKDIHPSVIISGYKAAQEHIQKYLEDNARDIDLNDNEALIKIASVSVAGKTLDVDPSHIGKLCVEAIKTIAETTDRKLNIDQDNVQIIKKKGGAVRDSEIVKGMVLKRK